MSLLSFLGGLFGKHPGSSQGALRNKVGGLAWVRDLDPFGLGAEILNGAVVKTVGAKPDGFWATDPVLDFVVRKPCLSENRRLAMPGDKVSILGIHDDCLVPIPGGLASHEEVRELFAPRLRRGEKAHV